MVAIFLLLNLSSSYFAFECPLPILFLRDLITCQLCCFFVSFLREVMVEILLKESLNSLQHLIITFARGYRMYIKRQTNPKWLSNS